MGRREFLAAGAGRAVDNIIAFEGRPQRRVV
jgi:hypothetical protein